MSRPGEPTLPAARRAVPRTPAAPRLDEEAFARDLGLMLRSGLSLMEALKTLRERRTGAGSRALDTLALRLTQGEALSQAMAGSGAFGAALVACVRSSEATGDLADSLQRFAVNAARLRVLRGKLVSALVYPALLIGVASLVVVFLLVYVVPRFAQILETSGREVPMMSRALIALGRTLGAVPPAGWAVLGAAVAWWVVLFVRAARERRVDAALSAFAERIPGLRDLVRRFAFSRFTRSGAMLVRSGVPVLKALPMCRALLASADRVPLDRAVAQASAGAPLAAALHEHGIVDTLGLRVLRVAEQTGALDEALERLADVHDQDLEDVLERIGRLVEPLLMLAIGLVIGGIVVLMYLPIFQLASSF